jgi:transposase
MELSCKKCGSASFVKNGFVRGLQRYRCRSCGFNFTATPNRGRWGPSCGKVTIPIPAIV